MIDPTRRRPKNSMADTLLQLLISVLSYFAYTRRHDADYQCRWQRAAVLPVAIAISGDQGWAEQLNSMIGSLIGYRRSPSLILLLTKNNPAPCTRYGTRALRIPISSKIPQRHPTPMTASQTEWVRVRLPLSMLV